MSLRSPSAYQKRAKSQVTVGRFVMDGFGQLEIIIASVIFSYMAVYYRFVYDIHVPCLVMLWFLAFGYFMAWASGLMVHKTEKFDVQLVIAGLMAYVMVQVVNFVTASFMNYDFLGTWSGKPVGGEGVVVTISPFYMLLFYASVGVAEESFFTLFIGGWMLRLLKNPWLAAIPKSVMFVVYHNAVAQEIFSRTIFSVPQYSWILYVGSYFWTVFFYWLKHFSVPATAHATYNFFTELVNLVSLT